MHLGYPLTFGMDYNLDLRLLNVFLLPFIGKGVSVSHVDDHIL